MNKLKEGDAPRPLLSVPQCLIRKGPEAERLSQQAPSRVCGRVGKGTTSSEAGEQGLDLCSVRTLVVPSTALFPRKVFLLNETPPTKAHKGHAEW